MFCAHCGSQIPPGGRFCGSCGQPAGTRPGAQPVRPSGSSDARPHKKGTTGTNNTKNTKNAKTAKNTKNVKGDKKEKRGAEVGRVILFTFVGLMLLFLALKRLVPSFIGVSTPATVTSITFKDTGRDGGRTRSRFYLDYDYTTADGKLCHDYTTWRGWGHTPDAGYGRYHVCYVPSAPWMNRFMEDESIKYQIRDIRVAKATWATGWEIKEMKLVLVKNLLLDIFAYGLELLAAWFCLAIAWPFIPFFWSFKKRE